MIYTYLFFSLVLGNILEFRIYPGVILFSLFLFSGILNVFFLLNTVLMILISASFYKIQICSNLVLSELKT